jgi:hypothetical protein
MHRREGAKQVALGEQTVEDGEGQALVVSVKILVSGRC